MATNQLDVIEAAARMEFDGSDDVVNTYQFQLQTSTPVSQVDTINNIVDILESLYTIIVAVQSILLVYKDIRITNQTQQLLLGTVPWASLVDGSNADDAVPPGCCALLNFNTQISRVSPRKYFGVFTEGNLDTDGTWGPALVTDISDIGVLLLSDFVRVAGTWRYGYFSPKTSAFEVPVGALTGNIPAYQRRRKQGRGS